MRKKIITGFLMLSLFLGVFTGCNDSSSSNTTSDNSNNLDNGTVTQTENADGVKTITVAHTSAFVPYCYLNSNGESDGFEVQVLKLVDELLDEYKFEFIATTDDDLLIGVESGKYDLGVKGAWYTEERAEKYVFPKNNIGASSIGITFKKDYEDEITDLESFAAFSGKLVPIAPQNAQYTVVQEYNEEHPDNQIDLIASESFDVADAYLWVLEGRYDAFFNIKTVYEANVLSEDGAYHQYADQLTYVVHKAIPTYPVFNKNNQELADAYDSAIEQLKERDELVDLQLEYFGEEVFQYLDA